MIDTCPSGLYLQTGTADMQDMYKSESCGNWKLACSLQSLDTARINICRHDMMTCPGGLFLQTGTAGTWNVQNNENWTQGGLAAVYNTIIQAEFLYEDIIWWPAQVDCTYNPVRHVHYISRKMNNALFKVSCHLQSHNTGRINICRHDMVTCRIGWYLQTSKVGTLYVQNNE